MTIDEAIKDYLEIIRQSRSIRTAATYRNGLKFFSIVLAERHLPIETTEISLLNEDAIGWLAAALKDYAAATEQLYLTAASGFYEYLAAEQLVPINLHG